MKIEAGKIMEATERELFNYYLKRDLDDIWPFPEYARLMEKAGVTIITKEDAERGGT